MRTENKKNAKHGSVPCFFMQKNGLYSRESRLYAYMGT